MTVPDLNFTIEGAEPLRFAAAPHIAFKLAVTNPTNVTIHSVIVKCQIQIDVSRRQYSAAEQSSLSDLFGESKRWSETLRTLLWTNATVVVPSFKGAISVALQVPCTFDFNVATTKYFAGINQGDIPVSFLFSGTIFYESDNSPLQVFPIPWEKEASFRMPINVWQDMMNAYYPNTTWLCLERNAFEKLSAYKIQHGLPTFEEALTKAMEARS